MKKTIGTSKSVKKYADGGPTGPGPKAMTMAQLKKKYPDVDTTKKGDVRGSEINAYAPAKIIKKYADTYDAFDKKFKGKDSYKKGGSVNKSKKK